MASETCCPCFFFFFQTSIRVSHQSHILTYLTLHTRQQTAPPPFQPPFIYTAHDAPAAGAARGGAGAPVGAWQGPRPQYHRHGGEAEEEQQQHHRCCRC